MTMTDAAASQPRSAADIRLARGGGRSLLAATFTLLSNILTGVLGLPFCFAHCGMLLGCALVAAVAASQVFTMRQLLYASAVHGLASFDELAEWALGRAARPLCLACVLALQFGCLVAFLGVLADVLSASVSPLVPPGADVGRADYMASLVLVLLPLCVLAREETTVARASVVSVVFLCGFTAATLFLAAAPRGDAPALAMWRPQGALLSLPVLVFAMTGHASLFSCVAGLRRPSLARADKLLCGATLAAGCVYAAVGVGGYATFRELTSGNLLRNLAEVGAHAGPRAAAVRHLRLGFALSIAGAVPSTLLPVRDAMLDMMLPDERAPSLMQHAAVCAAVLCFTLLFALVLPNVELVFALTGATSAVTLAYIFPAAIFLRAHGRHEQDVKSKPEEDGPPASPIVDELWASQEEAAAEEHAAMVARIECELFGALAGWPARALSWALLCFGVAAMWLGTAAALRAVSEEAAVVTLAHEIALQTEAVSQATGHAQAACALLASGACVPPPAAQVLARERSDDSRASSRNAHAPHYHVSSLAERQASASAAILVAAEAAAGLGADSADPTLVARAVEVAAALEAEHTLAAAPPLLGPVADAAAADVVAGTLGRTHLSLPDE